MLFLSAIVHAAEPRIYAQPYYESPVRGNPDDLLMLPGYGFSADDAVVYRAIYDTTAAAALKAPAALPAESDSEFGRATVVSTADIPYSLTVMLPRNLRVGQSYVLWVRNSAGDWSNGVRINDARPLWITPAFVYSSAPLASLAREIKIVGRNLAASAGHSTRVQLIGPQRITQTVSSRAEPGALLDDYVARVPLPARLAPGNYRVLVSRDDSSWVPVEGQSLEVRPDPKAAARFAVDEPRFGGCRADDGRDDAACIVAAIAAASKAGGGVVYFGPGKWDLIDAKLAGSAAGEGILVAPGVQLRGAGSEVTRLQRHASWNQPGPAPAFTLLQRTSVQGFTLADLQIYRANDLAGAFLQLGVDPQRAAADGSGSLVSEILITRNVFDKPMVAIGSTGLPIERLIVADNVFGAFHSALQLTGDRYNVRQLYRIDDSIIAHNVFKPGSKLDMIQKTGTGVSELGAGHRLDFSDNNADGNSTEYLYSPDDARGWRSAFFWNLGGNVDESLIAGNSASCTGDKVGDGEAISFDNNVNTFAFAGAVPVLRADADHVEVATELAARQNARDVPVESYYVGHWVQIVSGPGLGQVRRIVGYSRDPATHSTRFEIAPAWDVLPDARLTRMTVGREYWQVYTIDNRVDNRRPLCKKSNRSRKVAGNIGLWAQGADMVIAGNRQYDSDGIFLYQAYMTPEHPCADCTMQGFFQSAIEVRGNVIDGEYDWNTDCSVSGITVGIAAAPWEATPPPSVGVGVSIAHNTIRHADSQYSGAIAQVSTWYSGPEPHRWPLSDNVLIHHNDIQDIAGARANNACGTSRARVGIAFPDPAIAWRSVLYANSCKNVSVPLGPGGVDSVKVCPSSASHSCECAGAPYQ